MVKAKQLKLFRKKIDQAERLVANPLHLLHIPSPTMTASFYNTQLPPPLLHSCLQLYHTNMEPFHRADEADKREEFTHRTSRFIVIQDDTTNRLAGYVHYRICCDDDEDPSDVVVYIYELQIAQPRQGLGKALMGAAERIAQAGGLSRIMLTVTKRNTTAMAFYYAMGMSIDATSPSQHGEVNEEYEIMSKVVDG